MYTAYSRGCDHNYTIGDEEYGYELCRISFYQELADKLTPGDLDVLADKIAELINVKLDSVTE